MVVDGAPLNTLRSGPVADEDLLHVEDLAINFGGVRALEGASVSVARGCIAGLIGPNGAGKTTLFNCVMRIATPRAGRITFDRRDLLRERVDTIAKLGISRTFQNVGLFATMSVLDNVLVGAYSVTRAGFIDCAFDRRSKRREEAASVEECLDILDRVGLRHLARRPVHGLPFGTLKRVELARALAARPRLLLLDEPANGLAQGEVDELAELLMYIRRRHDLTIVLVEHHMGLVMRISDAVTVLDHGRTIASGSPEQIQRNPTVIEAYLGAPL